MSDAQLRLDGNAAAGLLAEIFLREMTISWATCAHCGAESQLGHLLVYMHAPGTVFRCTVCGQVVMRIVKGPAQLCLDLSGVRRMVLDASA